MAFFLSTDPTVIPHPPVRVFYGRFWEGVLDDLMGCGHYPTDGKQETDSKTMLSLLQGAIYPDREDLALGTVYGVSGMEFCA